MAYMARSQSRTYTTLAFFLGMVMATAKKVVLAYSGGLDTSVIVRWLQETYQCEVVTFTADIGQGEEVEPARAKAQALGVEEIHIEDLRDCLLYTSDAADE